MLLWQIAPTLAIENAIPSIGPSSGSASTQRDRWLLLDVNNTLVSQLDARSLWPPSSNGAQGLGDYAA
jgi:hypothetical protein